MPVPENEVLGVNVLLKADTTGDGTADAQIGGQQSATLDVTAGIIETNTKESGLWRDSLKGAAGWSISADQLYTEDDDLHAVGANGEASIDVTYDPGSGSVTETLQGLTSIDVEFSADTSNTGTLEDDLWERFIVTGLQADISTSGVYFDPESADGAALKLLLDAQDAGEVVGVSITFGEISLGGSVRPGDFSIDFPGNGDRATVDFSLGAEGPITRTTASDIDSGLEALMAAFFGASTIQVLLEYQDNGTAEPGATAWNGDAWVSSLSLAAEFGEALTIAAELTGQGPLTRATQT